MEKEFNNDVQEGMLILNRERERKVIVELFKETQTDLNSYGKNIDSKV